MLEVSRYGAERREELLAEARASLERSHPANPPDRKFGAAVLSSSGEIFSSSAYWSETLALCLHAEQTALAVAAAHAQREIVAIATISTEDPEGKAHCHPCGICKQLLYESSQFSGIDIQVYMSNLEGDVIEKRISELVLFPWPAPKSG